MRPLFQTGVLATLAMVRYSGNLSSLVKRLKKSPLRKDVINGQKMENLEKDRK